MDERACEHCETMFKPVKKSRRFCSKPCSTKATAKTRKTRGKCQLCGAECAGATVVICVACRQGGELLAHEERRFWSKVRRGDECECWEWIGGSWNKNGYGFFHTTEPRKMVMAHRYAWRLQHGDPGEMCVCHRCDNPKCVNPGHLFLGTQQENMADKVAKGRQARGERQGHARLTEGIIRSIRARREEGALLREIAAEFDIYYSMVVKIVRREAWAHVA